MCVIECCVTSRKNCSGSKLGIATRVAPLNSAGSIISQVPFEYNAVVERLATEFDAVFVNVQEAFDRYIKRGRPAYVPRYKLTPFERFWQQACC